MITNRDFLEETYEKAQKGLRTLRTEITRKGLKDLRVTIKRLRTFALLTDYITYVHHRSEQTHFVVDLKLFKKIFRASGGLRDSELTLKFLDKYEQIVSVDCPEFRTHILQQNTSFESDFKAAFEKMNRLTFLKINLNLINTLKSMDKAFLIDRTTRWMEEQTAIYQDLRNNIHEEETIHSIRKILKQLYFTQELTHIEFPNQNQYSQSGSLAQNLKSIGKWHDRVIFRDKMMAFLKDTNLEKNLEKPYFKLIACLEKEAQQHLKSAGIDFVSAQSNSILLDAKKRSQS